MEDLNKFYASFWKQSSSALSGLHSVHEHKLMTLGSRHNQTQGVSINSNKRKSLPGFVDLNSDVRTSIRRKSDAYHGVIDLEKPSISGDAVEAIGCSGFGNLANQNGKSQDGSCCISPENTSVAESLQFCRDWNASRVSVGSVGSSDTPDCQSPIKTSNTEARHSLFDLNVPQEEIFLMPPTVFPSSSTHRGKFSDNHREASGKECVSGSGIGSMKGSSITVITPNSVPDSSRDVITESSVQQKFLFDLNVSPECTDMPSEINDYREKVVNNDVSNGTAPDHSFSTKNSLHAETSAKHVVLGNDHMLAHKDDSDMLLTAPTTIIKVQWPESGTINKELFIPGSPLVDNNFHSRLGLSHSGTLNIQELSMLQDKVDDDGTTVDIAARTLLSIFQRRSECIDHRFGSSNQTAAAQNGDDEPQPSLDSFENIVVNLEEIKDDGQSINVPTPYNEGPACRIKLKRGRGMRNFHREIIPGLLLGKQEICDDLEVIGYEPKKTRSRKTRKGPGASSSRPRLRKRGAVKH